MARKTQQAFQRNFGDFLAQNPLFSELLSPVPEEPLSTSEILTCVPLEELRKLFRIDYAEEDYRHHLEEARKQRAAREERLAARRRALSHAQELKLQNEAASREARWQRIVSRVLAVYAAAYKMGQDREAVRKWLEKTFPAPREGTLAEWETWANSLNVPESLRGKLKRPPDLPDCPTLLDEYDKFYGRARQVVGKKDRFKKLPKNFPELPIKLLSRFREGRFFPSRLAKEVLAHLYGVSVKTLERRLTEARRNAANSTHPTPRRSA